MFLSHNGQNESGMESETANVWPRKRAGNKWAWGDMPIDQGGSRHAH